MKRIAIIAAITALAALLAWQVYTIFKPAPEPAEEAVEAEEVDDYADYSDPILSEIIDTVNLASTPVTDAYGHAATLGELAADTTVLYCRYSEAGCRPCIDDVMDKIETWRDRHPGSKVALLLRDIDSRSLFVTQKDYGNRFTLYDARIVPVDVEGATTPVLFRLHADGTLRDFFQVVYGDYDQTARFLDSIPRP